MLTGVTSTLIRLFTLFGLSLALSFQAHALEAGGANSLLEQVHDLRIRAYLAVNDYYNFAASGGDATLLEEIREHIAAADAFWSQVNERDDLADVQDNIDGINTQWEAYKELININIDDILDTGYADLRLASDLAKTNLALVEQTRLLEEKAQSVTRITTHPVVKLSRDQATLLAGMMTKYSARNNSNITQVFQGANNEVSLDQLATEFSQQLNQLEAQATEGAAKPLMNAIRSKWRFIENSYINFDENNVVFVVNRYSKGIIEELAQVASVYEG